MQDFDQAIRERAYQLWDRKRSRRWKSRRSLAGSAARDFERIARGSRPRDARRGTEDRKAQEGEGAAKTACSLGNRERIMRVVV
jgi:hypothetical protein